MNSVLTRIMGITEKSTSIYSWGWLLALSFVITMPNVVSFIRIPGPLQLARVIFISMTVILVGILLRFRPRVYVAILSPILLLEYPDMVHMLEYGRHLSVGAIASMFYSDSKEAMEFLWHDASSTFGTGLGLTTSIISLGFFAPAAMPRLSVPRYLLVSSTVFIVPPVFDVADTFPIYPLRQAGQFFRVQKEFEYEVARRSQIKVDIVDNHSRDRVLFVLVLGETAGREHMGVYGYARNTTPWLSQQSEAIVFSDVSAPANLTQNSVPLLLTSATAKTAEAFFDSPSLINLAHSAGFSTYWLSNQSKFSFNENKVSVLANEAQTRKFRNTGTVSTLDEMLLADLREVIEDQEAYKQFVVLHLLGSHAEYKQRYPKNFDAFQDKPPGVTVDDVNVWGRINTYDNSIRYTDFMLEKVVGLVLQQARPACVLYVSDHGEYLSRSKAVSGHGFPTASRPESEIPLVVLCSPEYWARYPEKQANLRTNRALPIAAEDIFYAVSEFLDLEFEGMRHQRSFASKQYSPPARRWIMNGQESLDEVANLKGEPVFQ